jgi:hypothetical protein
VNGSRRVIAISSAAVVAVLVLWWTAASFYLGPRATLRTKIGETQSRVKSLRDTLRQASQVEKDIAAFADRTLGADVETVDHRLRTRLNRLAEAVGIRGAVVNSGNASAQQSPARSQFKGRYRELRDRVDFIELDGSITAEMTFAQVIELVDRLQAEPWMKHLNSVRIEPKGDGDRYAASVRLTTVFIPGRAPVSLEATTYDAHRLAR